MKFSLFISLLLFTQSLFSQKVGVGQWATEFSVADPIVAIVETKDRIWAARNMGLVYVNMDNFSLQNFTKVDGLSGIGITAASYHTPNSKLIVGYEDGRIDILKGENVYTIYDIQRKNIIGSKSVNKISMFKQYAYLSMAFGIVVLDLNKNEVVDTYFIGENNKSVNVLGIAIAEQKIYANTENGVYTANVSAPNLNDYNAWSMEVGLPLSNFSIISEGHGKVILVAKGEQDSVYVQQNGIWNYQPTSTFDKIALYEATSAGFVRSVSSHSQQWRVELLDKNLETTFSFQLPWGDPDRVRPHSAMLHKDSELWVGQGLGIVFSVNTKTGVYRAIEQDGASFNNAYSVSCGSGLFMMTAGGLFSNYSSKWAPFQLSVYSKEGWGNYNRESLPLQDFVDATYAIADPYSPGVFYAGSSRSGLLEFSGDKLVKVYNTTNSALGRSEIQDSLFCRVLGMAFDSKGDLWICNSTAKNALVQKKRDGTWKSYSISSFFNLDISQMIVDYYDQKWIVGRGGKLFVCREKNGIMECLNINVNHGNDLNASFVYSVMEDEDGYIWIGTDRGPRVIYTSAKMFNNPMGDYSSVESKVVYVIDGDKAPELLRNEAIVNIQIDGANRKWIGTQSNGVYLVSPDGTQEIYHFTSDNSPLIANSIQEIAVDKEDGYVYFATTLGVVSYRSDASLAPEIVEELIAFPNPVKSNYSGVISIKGLANNADVKIVDTKGSLIYRTKAQGGQAVWDGKNFKGQRPNSGVLLIFSTNEDGSVTKSGKIFFVR